MTLKHLKTQRQSRLQFCILCILFLYHVPVPENAESLSKPGIGSPGTASRRCPLAVVHKALWPPSSTPDECQVCGVNERIVYHFTAIVQVHPWLEMVASCTVDLVHHEREKACAVAPPPSESDTDASLSSSTASQAPPLLLSMVAASSKSSADSIYCMPSIPRRALCWTGNYRRPILASRFLPCAVRRVGFRSSKLTLQFPATTTRPASQNTSRHSRSLVHRNYPITMTCQSRRP